STTAQNTILGSGFADLSDFNCVAAGKENDANAKTAKAITNDLGNNIDQDGACGLSASGDQTKVDPKLTSIAENGGPIPTQALLHGSAAIDGGNDAACPATDARGTTRPQGTHCDVGAFEAVLLGAPSATTEPPQGITASAATLEATINLTGEAGGFRFLWGLSAGALTEETPETAAGAISSATPEREELPGLSANTTYFYKAVADNASASTQAGNVRSFTTPAAGPVISEASATAITETTAKIDITINPGGADTEYRVEYGHDNSYGQHTEFTDIGAASSPQEVEVPLTGLEAGSTYHFDVVAKNSVEPGGVSSEDRQFTTEPEGGAPRGPEISEVSVASVSETTAKIGLTINPDGADTKYRIDYGSEDPFEEDTEFVDIGSGHTPKHLEATLTELEPATTYHFIVEAENEQSDGSETSAEMEFTTASEGSQPGPPLVSEAKVASTTLTSATLEFSIDPDGADTTYVVKYGPGSPPTQETAPVDIGATHGVQHITRTLTG
ncbi:MAG: fibronectin type III domain-containing protein, partial [Bryobacteraceae bacterium]